MSEKINISNISEDSGENIAIIKSKSDLTKRKLFLKDKTIGISISESEELNQLGFDVAHLNDLVIETARYILSLGGKLAYGGDMRNGGFTEIIFDLLNYYKADSTVHLNERFHSYLAWPISLTLEESKQAELTHSVTFHKISPPAILNIADEKKFLSPETKEDFFIWSKCLTEMRTIMDSNCAARVFVGGKTKGFKGKCPGILEELLIAIEQNCPVYLIGVFGGISSDAIAAIDGNQTERFKKEYYLEDKTYADFYNYYNEKSETPIDFDSYFKTLKDLNWDGLAQLNGLTIEENKRLSVTPHISEIIFLIIKGLKTKFLK